MCKTHEASFSCSIQRWKDRIMNSKGKSRVLTEMSLLAALFSFLMIAGTIGVPVAYAKEPIDSDKFTKDVVEEEGSKKDECLISTEQSNTRKYCLQVKGRDDSVDLSARAKRRAMKLKIIHESK